MTEPEYSKLFKILLGVGIAIFVVSFFIVQAGILGLFG